MRMMALTLLLAGLAGWAGWSVGETPQEKKERPKQVIISGMVFTERGFSLPGASVRVNRAGERKTRWEAVSDRQGEFGVWVPQGGEYEVHVKAKGFQEQMQKADGNTGTQQKLVFRMSPLPAEKKK